MISFVVRRILLAIPITFGVSIVCFALIYLAPGDPLSAVLPPDASGDMLEIVKHEYGFDRPIPFQYMIWLGKVLTGDLGTSIATGRPVSEELLRAIRNTGVLVAFAAPLAILLGCSLGFLAASYPSRVVGPVVTTVSVVGVSLPSYWLAIVLVVVFAVELTVLPAAGMGTQGSAHFKISDWREAKFLVLPVLTLAATPIGILARTTRGVVAELLNQDFVTALRGKGLRERVVLSHVLMNALPLMLAVIGLQLGDLLGGSILVETVFTWPGTGYLLAKAITLRDVPMLQGTVLFLSLIFVAINLLVDLLQSVIDPRIRRA